MTKFLLEWCLINICILHLLENIGFIFRIAGIEENNLVAGYSFQSTLQFSSRIIVAFFMPAFALLADSGELSINYFEILIYFFTLFYFIFTCIYKVKEVIKIQRLILKCQLSGKSVFRSIFQRKVILGFIKVFFSFNFPRNFFSIFSNKLNIDNKEGSKIIRNLSLTYIPFYSCWIFIALLISIFPEIPSFLISLSTFFTFSSTIYQSLFFDPFMARYVNNEDFTRNIYLKLQILKLRSVAISFFMCSFIFLVLRLSKVN